MIDDLRFGLRKLRQQPAFTAMAVLTLALGIGATAAVFSLIQGVLMTPPPYRQPQQLVLMPSVPIDGQADGRLRGWAAAQWHGMAARGEVVRVDRGVRVDVQLPDFGRGQRIARGHGRHQGLLSRGRPRAAARPHFPESETAVPPAPVIVIGYELWQRKFNGDPNIIGKTIRMSRRDTPPTVIGVMPPGVRFLPSPRTAQEPNYNVNALVDFWMPAAPNPERLKQPTWDVVGRLRDGAHARSGASRDHGHRREAGAGRSATSKASRLGRSLLTDEMNSRRPTHPAAAARRGGARAPDRVRERRGAAAGARAAAAAGIRGAKRAWRRPRGALPSGVDGESAAGAGWAARRRGPGVRHRQVCSS